MNKLIQCPRCGREYHFQEIFMPKTIFQDVEHILRDKTGKIIEIIGETFPMEELYFCDQCDAPLKIEAFFQFNVDIDDKIDFTKNTTTVISK